jgi:hypothetical protein
MSRSIALAAAAAAALATAAPAPASTGDASPPIARAADDAPPIVPSLIQTRITRTENALERLTNYVDDGDAAGVARTGQVVRRQLAAAWRGAVYYLNNPPAPVDEGLARAAADDPELPVVADQYAAAAAVFETYHASAATAAELIDGARVPVLDALSTTLFWTLDARDKAITKAHTYDVPADPEAEGEPVGFATVMPAVIATLDDEIQQIKGLIADATDLRPGGMKLLRSGLAQTLLTQNTMNTYWPPVIEG